MPYFFCVYQNFLLILSIKYVKIKKNERNIKGKGIAMKLTIEDIKKITQGAACIKENQGRVKFYRFTEAGLNISERDVIYATAGIQLEFKTDAKAMNLSVFAVQTSVSRSFFAVDVFEDDIYKGSVKNISDEKKEAYSLEKYPFGSFGASFAFDGADKTIRIVLPHSVAVEIEELELVGATYFEPLKHDKTIVMYGDSITQGFDAIHPSCTYAVMLARALNATLYNQGIGGALFVPELPKLSVHKSPDYITIAYGTNDWNKTDQKSFYESCSEFMKNISETYPDSKKIVITPIWRADFEEERPFGKFSEVERIIKEVCKDHPDIRLVSGWDLVPHDAKMYGDLRLHPSDEGFEYYFKNLKEEVLL